MLEQRLLSLPTDSPEHLGNCLHTIFDKGTRDKDTQMSLTVV